MSSILPVSPYEQKRIDGVDALRALAIFFVLMNHVNMRLHLARVPYTKGLPDQLVASLVWNGGAGVQIFFAVSGFLITSTALRRWGDLATVSFRGFYLMRFARIAPLLAALLTVLSVLHLAGLKDFVVPDKTGGLGRALFAALTFHVNVLEARRGYLPANWDILWSLSVEEIFYLFFPIAARVLGRRKLFVALLCALVAVGPCARAVLANGNEVWREYSYLGGMDAIAWGCLTALLLSRFRFTRRMLWTLWLAGMGMLVFILGCTIRAESWGLTRTGLEMSVLAIGTCLIMIAAAQSGWKSPAFFRPLLSLGKNSYEIYLTHMFVVFAVFAVFLDIGKPMYAVVPMFLAVILLSAICGSLVARYFSEPMNRRIRARWR